MGMLLTLRLGEGCLQINVALINLLEIAFRICDIRFSFPSVHGGKRFENASVHEDFFIRFRATYGFVKALVWTAPYVLSTGI